jgi:hypothetical protein
MKLEQQVTSLELSKRLKELGVRQESLFYFFGNKAELEAMRGYGGPEILLEGDYSWAVRVSAFTVAEIGEMLPPGMWSESLGLLPVLWLAAGWLPLGEISFCLRRAMRFVERHEVLQKKH